MAKIPENAKRVFKGVIFDVYQWEQKMFDGSTETFEMIKRPNTLQIIATVGDKIILAEEEQPNKPTFYSLLGGRAEEGEEPEITAKRELLEESGLESDEWKLLKTYAPYFKLDWTIFIFIARNCKKAAEQKLDAGEKIKLLELSFEEFLEKLQDEKFWGAEIANDIYRLSHDSAKLGEFKKKLFSS